MKIESIHLLRHRLHRIYQTPGHQPYRYENAPNNPHQRTQKHKPILPRLNMSHGQRGKIVGNQQSRKQSRTLCSERLRLNNMAGDGCLVSFLRRIKGTFVSCGHQFNCHIRQCDTGFIIHYVMCLLEWIVPRREWRTKGNIMNQMRDIRHFPMERIGILRRIHPEREQRGGPSPRIRTDRDANRTTHAWHLQRAEESAPLRTFFFNGPIVLNTVLGRFLIF
mmetsp:Transcript_10807/g.22928  ORF Transcript_10807/g.22928 Transcript_10807/m.22928 type:complete len:221 (+) Transcript_10807:245-907(+)